MDLDYKGRNEERRGKEWARKLKRKETVDVKLKVEKVRPTFVRKKYKSQQNRWNLVPSYMFQYRTGSKN